MASRQVGRVGPHEAGVDVGRTERPLAPSIAAERRLANSGRTLRTSLDEFDRATDERASATTDIRPLICAGASPASSGRSRPGLVDDGIARRSASSAVGNRTAQRERRTLLGRQQIEVADHAQDPGARYRRWRCRDRASSPARPHRCRASIADGAVYHLAHEERRPNSASDFTRERRSRSVTMPNCPRPRRREPSSRRPAPCQPPPGAAISPVEMIGCLRTSRHRLLYRSNPPTSSASTVPGRGRSSSERARYPSRPAWRVAADILRRQGEAGRHLVRPRLEFGRYRRDHRRMGRTARLRRKIHDPSVVDELDGAVVRPPAPRRAICTPCSRSSSRRKSAHVGRRYGARDRLGVELLERWVPPLRNEATSLTNERKPRRRAARLRPEGGVGGAAGGRCVMLARGVPHEGRAARRGARAAHADDRPGARDRGDRLQHDRAARRDDDHGPPDRDDRRLHLAGDPRRPALAGGRSRSCSRWR